MAIAASDIEIRLSGGASNIDPTLSIGGVMSTVAGGVISGSLHTLWDAVNAQESADSDQEYRCVYVRNNHGSLSWQTVVGWLDAQPSSGVQLDIGIAAEGVNTSVAAIPDEGIRPIGVTFSRPVTKGAGVVIGTVQAGQFCGVWLRRAVPSGAAAGTDSPSVRFEGDTAP